MKAYKFGEKPCRGINQEHPTCGCLLNTVCASLYRHQKLCRYIKQENRAKQREYKGLGGTQWHEERQ